MVSPRICSFGLRFARCFDGGEYVPDKLCRDAIDDVGAACWTSHCDRHDYVVFWDEDEDGIIVDEIAGLAVKSMYTLASTFLTHRILCQYNTWIPSTSFERVNVSHKQ